MIEVEVRNLTKNYDGYPAVDDVNFAIESGRIYGFLGPNGAGKSTTMNIITGCLAASSGQVLIEGHDIFEEHSEAKKHLGYLPEMPPLYQDMTPLEYLTFVSEIKGIPRGKRAAAAEDVMSRTGVSEVKNRLIRQLSKGYRQRVGIAQALVGYPEVIILDEPTVGLDPGQIIEIRELIKSLGKEHTVLLSSHILSEISEICDEVLILSKGRLVARDTPENLGRIMNPSSRLRVVAEGSPEAGRAALAGVEGINRLEISRLEGAEILIEAEAVNDIRNGVFYALAAAGMPIHEMASQKMTLEDIFLEYTGSGKESGT